MDVPGLHNLSKLSAALPGTLHLQMFTPQRGEQLSSKTPVKHTNIGRSFSQHRTDAYPLLCCLHSCFMKMVPKVLARSAVPTFHAQDGGWGGGWEVGPTLPAHVPPSLPLASTYLPPSPPDAPPSKHSKLISSAIPSGAALRRCLPTCLQCAKHSVLAAAGLSGALTSLVLSHISARVCSNMLAF